MSVSKLSVCCDLKTDSSSIHAGCCYGEKYQLSLHIIIDLAVVASSLHVHILHPCVLHFNPNALLFLHAFISTL